MCLLAVVFLAATVSTEVVGQQVEIEGIGTQLAQDCGIYIRWLDGESRPPNSDFSNSVCLGLVRGVFDMSGLLSPSSGVCYDAERVTVGQAIRVTLRYFDSHPEELGERDTSLILRALQDAFPCQ